MGLVCGVVRSYLRRMVLLDVGVAMNVEIVMIKGKGIKGNMLAGIGEHACWHRGYLLMKGE
jgi:hypothetical protein